MLKNTLTLKKASRAVEIADGLSGKNLVLIVRGDSLYVGTVQLGGCSGDQLDSNFYVLGVTGYSGAEQAMTKLATYAGIDYSEMKDQLLSPWYGEKPKKKAQKGAVIHPPSEVPEGMTMAQFFAQKLT